MIPILKQGILKSHLKRYPTRVSNECSSRRGFTQTKEEPKCMVLDLINFGALFKGSKVGTELNNNWRNCCIANSGENGKGKSSIELGFGI